MTSYRENNDLDKEPMLINKFYDKLMKVEAEKSQDSKDKIKEVITREIENQIDSIKRYNKNKEPIFLSYQDIGCLEFKIAKNYIESLGFKASIHRGNYFFQKVYDKLYIYGNPINIIPINGISIMTFIIAGFTILLKSLSLIDDGYKFDYNKFIHSLYNFDFLGILVKFSILLFFVLPITILLIQALFFFLWKTYCFFSYFSFRSGVIKVNW